MPRCRGRRWHGAAALTPLLRREVPPARLLETQLLRRRGVPTPPAAARAREGGAARRARRVLLQEHLLTTARRRRRARPLAPRLALPLAALMATRASISPTRRARDLGSGAPRVSRGSGGYRTAAGGGGDAVHRRPPAGGVQEAARCLSYHGGVGRAWRVALGPVLLRCPAPPPVEGWWLRLTHVARAALATRAPAAPAPVAAGRGVCSRLTRGCMAPFWAPLWRGRGRGWGVQCPRRPWRLLRRDLLLPLRATRALER
jgi:hypothetical protein